MAPPILIYAVVAFTTWAFGGTEAWAIRISAGLAGAAAVVAGIECARAGDPSRRWDVRWVTALGALALFMAIQAVNPSHDHHPDAADLVSRAHVDGLPASVSAPATWHALMVFGVCAVVFVVTRAVLSRRQVEALAQGCLANGLVMALFVFVRGGATQGGNELTGVFVNANQYAAYANLLMPLCFAMAHRARSRARREHRGSHPGYLLLGGGAIMAVSVFMSGSRVGALVCAFQLGSWAILEWRVERGEARRGVSAWTRALIPGMAVAAMLWVSGGEMLARKLSLLEGSISLQVEARTALWRSTAAILVDRPWSGIGAGTFAAAYPYYQPASLAGFYRHAHCDWLQTLAELGVVGALLAGLALAAACLPVRCDQNRERPVSPWLVRAAALGLSGVALHAIVDFPLRAPAVAVTAAFYLALVGFREGRKHTDRDGNQRDTVTAPDGTPDVP